METFLGPKKKIIFECKFCDYKSSKKSQYDRHLLTLKHKRTQTATVLGPKKNMYVNVEKNILTVDRYINIEINVNIVKYLII